MTKVIEQFRDAKDSIGGTVTCVIRNCPIGLGEPVFDKFEAMLGHAMMSIPATKGFEIGSGFGGCEVPGSVHNDAFILAASVQAGQNGTAGKQKLTTKTNNSGGIQGGISNGAPIYFRVAFKPPATIGQAQSTVSSPIHNSFVIRGARRYIIRWISLTIHCMQYSYGFEEGTLEAKGRHDPCVVPRAVPIVEAMAALVIIDALMAQTAREHARSLLPPLKTTLPVKNGA